MSSAKNEKLTVAFKKNAVEIIDQITSHDVNSYRGMLQKLLRGWITSPLELEASERLDMIILWEDLDEYLLQIQKLQTKSMLNFIILTRYERFKILRKPLFF